MNATYPTFNTPVTDRDLQDLYAVFNTRYFGGELPACRTKMAPLAKNFLGKFHYGLGSGGSDYLITVATIIENDAKAVVDTMLHEMIHVWQRRMAEKTGDSRYLDDTFFDRLVAKEANERHHGRYFKRWMDRFNEIGFNVDIAGDAPVDLEITRDFYGVIFHNGNSDSCVILYSDKDISKQLDDLIPSVEERMGTNFYTGISAFRTRDSLILQATRVTKAGKLPKNVLNIQYKDSAADAILNSPHTHLVPTPVSGVTAKERASSRDEGIPREVVQLLPRLHKHRGSDFHSYLASVGMNVKGLGLSRTLTQDGEVLAGSRVQRDTPIDGVDPSLVAFVYDDWADISNVEIKRSHAVKMTKTALSFGILSAEKKLRDRDVEEMVSRYNRCFADRVEPARFIQLVKEQNVSWMAADAKKYRKNITKDDIARIVDTLADWDDVENRMEAGRSPAEEHAQGMKM